MFIFLYRLSGGDDHCDQRGKACLKYFCDTFDSDRCMNSLTRGYECPCVVGPCRNVPSLILITEYPRLDMLDKF